MTEKNIYKLCIKVGNSIYAPAIVGYLSDGSYFIKDLSRTKGLYGILKMRIKENEMQGFGIHHIPIQRVKQWKTTHRPKIIHHISGKVQISGTGIVSGNFKTTKTPKGVQVKSPHHTDGGPMAAFTFWGESNFEEIDPLQIQDNHIVFSSDELVDAHPGLHETDTKTEAYTFEFFYMDKRIYQVVNNGDKVQMKHPNFGLVTLKILRHNTNNPAVFAVMCIKSKVGFASSHGSVYGGGATQSFDGYHEQILVTSPLIGEDKKSKNLDFSPRFRLMCLIDDWLSKIFP